MSPDRAVPRRYLPTSPFKRPEPEPPADDYSVDDMVSHDTYGLGKVTSVEERVALVIDFGTHVRRITTPSAKLIKL